MLTLGRRTAQEKVASLLYLIATHAEPQTANSSTFDLPLSRAEIADFLRLSACAADKHSCMALKVVMSLSYHRLRQARTLQFRLD